MASGISPFAATNITGDISSALTAAGTNKATALLLASAENYVSITSSGKGVMLPAMAQGDDVSVYNGGANTLLVYTNTGSDTITNGSANGGFSIATMRSANFSKVTSSLIMVNYSA